MQQRKAFVYLRVSGKSQVDGDGFPRQIAAIKSYAAAHSIRIARIFRESGVPGTKDLEQRPALQELLMALHSNGVKYVLIEKLDRLARDLMVQETIISDMRKHGFEIISVSEPDLCSDDPSRKLMRQIFGSIAEYEKSMLVLKLRGAKLRWKARTGLREGRKPYGSRPGEPEIIERMKQMRKNGYAVDAIASKLNVEEVKPRAGKKWYATSVYRILKGAGAI
jgi:DNA invertase Pin-like site-specific DNA recombinase